MCTDRACNGTRPKREAAREAVVSNMSTLLAMVSVGERNVSGRNATTEPVKNLLRTIPTSWNYISNQ